MSHQTVATTTGIEAEMMSRFPVFFFSSDFPKSIITPATPSPIVTPASNSTPPSIRKSTGSPEANSGETFIFAERYRWAAAGAAPTLVLAPG
jgi:hypothetical protein